MSRPGLWVGALALFVALGPATAWAGRPLDTEDTGTVEPGKAELELSSAFASNPEDNSWSVNGVLSVGLLPRLEARVESALLLIEPEDQRPRGGIGDSLFGAKYRLLDEAETRPAVLGAFTLRLPTGDDERGLGDEDVDVGFLAVVSKAFGPAHTHVERRLHVCHAGQGAGFLDLCRIGRIPHYQSSRAGGGGGRHRGG